jgi:transcriptional regulator with XRE-family HTH domain
MKRKSGIGENVLRLRHAKNLTQTELADLTGLSLPTIKNIEGGKDIAKRSTLSAVALALGAGVDDLLIPPRHFSAVRFRNAKYLRLKWQILSELSEKLDKYCELERLNGLYLPPRYKSIKERDVVKLAALIRKKLKISSKEGVVDIASAASFLGIKLLKVNADTDKFTGLSVGESDGGPAVIINENWRYSYEKIIFTIAREIAHLLLHRTKDKERINLEAEEAEVFASHFLMPYEGLIFYWDSGENLHWTEKVLKLKRIYSIPCPEILTRLRQLHRFSYVDSAVLETKFLRAFDGNPDPHPLKINVNFEERFAYLAILSLHKKLITPQAAAEQLEITEEAAVNLAEDMDYLPALPQINTRGI